MIVTTTRIIVRGENRQEFIQTLTSLIEPISEEKGCLTHRFYQEAGNENSFLLVGEWESQVDWDNFLKSDNFAVLLGSIETLGACPEIDFKLLSHIAGIEAVTKARMWCE